VVIEKPFGSDEQSARELNAEISSVFAEDQVSASTTTWPRRRCRTCWPCGSRTRSSNRSGTTQRSLNRLQFGFGRPGDSPTRSFMRCGVGQCERRPRPTLSVPRSRGSGLSRLTVSAKAVCIGRKRGVRSAAEKCVFGDLVGHAWGSRSVGEQPAGRGAQVDGFLFAAGGLADADLVHGGFSSRSLRR